MNINLTDFILGNHTKLIVGIYSPYTGNDPSMFNHSGSDVTTLAGTDSGIQSTAFHLSALQINFLVVGALFVAVIILGAFNIWIHTKVERQPCWSNVFGRFNSSHVRKKHTLKMNPSYTVFIV